jgi:hypothetical protein
VPVIPREASIDSVEYCDADPSSKVKVTTVFVPAADAG